MTTATRGGGPRYLRKIIRISAEDSPNVRLARAQIAAGKTPTDEVLVPGVLTWGEYQRRRRLWDKIKQCIGLDGLFYEGSELKLYPADWRARAEVLSTLLLGRDRRAKAIGVDPAEGGDKTAFSAVDELGLIELVSYSTPDTSMIPKYTIAFGRKHGVPPTSWIFDAGGGGKQHVDYLRDEGYGVRAVGFGQAVAPDPQRVRLQIEQRIDVDEEKYAYYDRRSQMFWELREQIDPSFNPRGFAIPPEYAEVLFPQMEPIPLTYDKEGRFKLLPKRNPNDEDDPRTLIKIIGHSPDELDSLVLAIHGMRHKKVPTAGTFDD